MKRPRVASPASQNVQQQSLSLGSPADSQPSADPKSKNLCPICFELWTAQGAHRLCSLKCGHFFGRECIEQFFARTKGKKSCPCCKAATRKSDVRNHFVADVSVLDAQLRDELTRALQTAEKRARDAEWLLSDAQRTVNVWKQKCENLVAENAQYKEAAAATSGGVQPSPTFENAVATPVSSSIKFSHQAVMGGLCDARCITFSRATNSMLISCRHPKSNQFGLLSVNAGDMSLARSKFYTLHEKPIRDVDCNAMTGLVLTASMDKSVSICTADSGALVHSIETLACAPFSCTWSSTDQHVFYCSSRSSVLVYDLRFPSTTVCTVSTAFAQPVHTIISEQQQLFIGSFGGCAVSRDHAQPQTLFSGGNLGYLGYNTRKRTLLATLRNPDVGSNVQHRIYRVEEKQVDAGGGGTMTATEVRTLYGDSRSVLFSRGDVTSLHVAGRHKSVAVVSDEGDRQACLWDATKGLRLHTIALGVEPLTQAIFFSDNSSSANSAQTKLSCLTKSCVFLHKFGEE